MNYLRKYNIKYNMQLNIGLTWIRTKTDGNTIFRLSVHMLTPVVDILFCLVHIEFISKVGKLF